MRPVTGAVQHYAWGDETALPRLLGLPADGEPWAELWLGTHPGGPAATGGRPLTELSGELPYLLKVLAAAQPLSLQTHPTRERAEAGFDGEEAAGVAIDAPTRVYKDRNPKPELLCALEPFDTLCGFRPLEGSLALLRTVGADALADHLEREGLAATVGGLYRGDVDPAPAVAACAGRPEPEAALVARLEAAYPGEPSVVVTLLLNRVLLQPGEAVFLAAGNLHAYLHGVGVEIMAASDNVVRGGLTPKHVDVEELLAVLDWTPLPDPVVAARPVGPGSFVYDTQGTPFRLWRHEVDGTIVHRATGRELLLCTAGAVGALQQGEAAYLAVDEDVSFTGHGTVFVAEERPGPT